MGGILTRLNATYANILSSKRSTMTHVFRFGAAWNAPLPIPPINWCGSRGFGVMLSPGKFSVLSSLTSELLRFL